MDALAQSCQRGRVDPVTRALEEPFDAAPAPASLKHAVNDHDVRHLASPFPEERPQTAPSCGSIRLVARCHKAPQHAAKHRGNTFAPTVQRQRWHELEK